VTKKYEGIHKELILLLITILLHLDFSLHFILYILYYIYIFSAFIARQLYAINLSTIPGDHFDLSLHMCNYNDISHRFL
jgi:hypothetical protein